MRCYKCSAEVKAYQVVYKGAKFEIQRCTNPQVCGRVIHVIRLTKEVN